MLAFDSSNSQLACRSGSGQLAGYDLYSEKHRVVRVEGVCEVHSTRRLNYVIK